MTFLLLLFPLFAHSEQPSPQNPWALSGDERLITILATNDIHGGVEAQKNKDGTVVGGMDFWTGVVRAIRAGLEQKWGARAGVLVVDAGDQFQGTLISNYNEGRLVFTGMNEVGYDAVVPGNHDYDFGPVGWREDRVRPGVGDQDPRGALKKLARKARFPLLSANTYLKDSLLGADGQRISVSGEGCIPQEKESAGKAAQTIQWKKALRPDFLKPFLVKEVAGVRVALIGLDNVHTPKTTTIENVSDLCFRDSVETYLETQEELAALGVDLYILIIHEGNTKTDFPVTKMVQEILARRPGSLHAVVSGHTHQYTKWVEKSVPIIQSFSDGRMFGRIDLVWDPVKRVLVQDKKRLFAALSLYHSKCAPTVSAFCQEIPAGTVASGAVSSVAYEGKTVTSDAKVARMLSAARKKVSKLADRKLGVADGELKRDRISESPLSNAMTDALLRVARTSQASIDIAFLNTGGLRDEINAGEVTYEELFRVLPFSNHAVLMGPMAMDQLAWLLNRSIQTCGSYGALMQSGLRVVFERDCRTPQEGGRSVGDRDEQAKLLRVETLGGELLIENGAVLPSQYGRVFDVATLDFLSEGGSGYSGFMGTPIKQDLGVLREKLTALFLKSPAQFTHQVDGRWKEVRPGSFVNPPEAPTGTPNAFR